jgi:hypothetical protein
LLLGSSFGIFPVSSLLNIANTSSGVSGVTMLFFEILCIPGLSQNPAHSQLVVGQAPPAIFSWNIFRKSFLSGASALSNMPYNFMVPWQFHRIFFLQFDKIIYKFVYTVFKQLSCFSMPLLPNS